MTRAQLNYFIHIFVEKLLYRQLAHQRAMLVIEQVLAFLIDTILVLVDRFVDAELLFGGQFQIFQVLARRNLFDGIHHLRQLRVGPGDEDEFGKDVLVLDMKLFLCELVLFLDCFFAIFRVVEILI